MGLGHIYLKQGSYAQAVTHLERALKVNPNHVEARYNLGLTYDRMGKLAEARKEFKTALTVVPDNAQIHHDLGTVPYRQGEARAAEQEWLQTVRLAPELNATWWNDLGTVQMELGHYTDAEQSFDSCLALQSDHLQCSGNLRSAWEQLPLVKAGQKAPPRCSRVGSGRLRGCVGRARCLGALSHFRMRLG